jgi:hypothetical protein
MLSSMHAGLPTSGLAGVALMAPAGCKCVAVLFGPCSTALCSVRWQGQHVQAREDLLLFICPQITPQHTVVLSVRFSQRCLSCYNAGA